MNWLIHDYRENDLVEVVHLIDSTAELGQESVFSLAECISALTSRQPAVVAVPQGAPIGAALACAAGERGWVMRIAISSAWRGRGLASALLVELERRLIAARVSRAYVLPEEDLLGEGLLNAGYTRAAQADTGLPGAGRAAAGVCDQLDLLAGPGVPAVHGRLGASAEDYLAAIAQCRPTVTPAMVDEFRADITAHARC